jgi:hypothetical protein
VVRYDPVGVLVYGMVYSIPWGRIGRIGSKLAPKSRISCAWPGKFLRSPRNISPHFRQRPALRQYWRYTGSHSPEWLPKIKSTLGISPDIGDRKINSEARFRQYGDRLKTLFRALVLRCQSWVHMAECTRSKQYVFVREHLPSSIFLLVAASLCGG